MKTNFYRIVLCCLSTLIFSCSTEETTSSDNQELLDRIEELEAQINSLDDLQDYISQITVLQDRVSELESSLETYDADLLNSLQIQINELQEIVNENADLLSMFDAYDLDNLVTINVSEYQDASTGFNEGFENLNEEYSFDKLIATGEGVTSAVRRVNSDGSNYYILNISHLSNNDYLTSYNRNSFEFSFLDNNGEVQFDSVRLFVSDYNQQQYFSINQWGNLYVQEDLNFEYEFDLQEFNQETNNLKFNFEITITDTKVVEGELANVKKNYSISFDNVIGQLYEYYTHTETDNLVCPDCVKTLFNEFDIYTQDDIDWFISEGYDSIEGDVYFDNSEELDFSGLTNLKYLKGGVYFFSDFIDNEDLEFLNNTIIDSYTFEFEIGSTSIEDLSFLSDNVKIESLYIAFQENLSSLSGIENIQGLEELYIEYCQSLVLIDSFDSSNLKKLTFTENYSLNNFCELSDVDFDALIIFNLSQNQFNPSQSDLESGNCSQE